MLLIKNYKEQIEKLIEERGYIPDEFWVKAEKADYSCLWFISGQKPSVEAFYDFDEERFGITKDGKIVWGYDSGCSCPSPWDDNFDGYNVKDEKQFFLEEMPELDEQWESTYQSNLEDYLKLIKSIKGELSTKEVFHIRNQEIRRYIMKRIGYETIKGDVDTKLIHKDGTSELLEISFGDTKERYVKVKDTSTEREYLLYVPNEIQRCRQGIAWTFGLKEEEYNPIIES